MSTLIIVGLLLFLVPGLAVLIGDHLLSGRETYTISTRELPNITTASTDADIGVAAAGTDRAAR
jgi:hypothetical protein